MESFWYSEASFICVLSVFCCRPLQSKNSGGTAGGGQSSGRSGEGILTFSVSDLLEAITSVGKNKALRWFFVPVVFFYITWQLDWSMWYLGQVKYCKMSEMTLSICNGVFNIGQLAAVGMIAKVVRKNRRILH